jgi:hypothetical protein
VIAHPGWFKLMAKLRRVERSVHAGVYEFPAGTSPWTVLTMLAHGKKAALRFTVPEGLTIQEVAALAAERLGLRSDSFVVAARDSQAASELLGMPVPSFEGFLRPETYVLPADLTARQLVRIMADGFKSEWKSAWDARLDTLKLTRLELVTLASIVEGEARVDAERETIAGVYRNRLRIGSLAAMTRSASGLRWRSKRGRRKRSQSWALPPRSSGDRSMLRVNRCWFLWHSIPPRACISSPAARRESSQGRWRRPFRTPSARLTLPSPRRVSSRAIS